MNTDIDFEIEITHDSRLAKVKKFGDSIYGVYDDDQDVFYHVSLDDDSLNPLVDLENEFGTDLVTRVIALLER